MTEPGIIDTDEEFERIRQFLATTEGMEDASERIGNLRAMLYGDDGTGKSIAGLALLNFTVPADKRIILVDTAENFLSLNNHPGLRTRLPDGMHRIVRLPYRGEAWLHGLEATIRNKVPPFDNIGGVQFDEFSTMADSMMGIILKVVEKANPARPKDDATWPEYKMLLRKMKNIIQIFSRLDGVQCTFIAHLRTSDKDGFGRVIEKPNFTPSVGPEIRKPMHLIANVTVDEEGVRKFQVHPDKTHLAKCKVGGITTREVLFGELAEKTRLWLNGEVPTAVEAPVVEPVITVQDSDTSGFDDFDVE